MTRRDVFKKLIACVPIVLVAPKPIAIKPCIKQLRYVDTGIRISSTSTMMSCPVALAAIDMYAYNEATNPKPFRMSMKCSEITSAITPKYRLTGQGNNGFRVWAEENYLNQKIKERIERGLRRVDFFREMQMRRV